MEALPVDAAEEDGKSNDEDPEEGLPEVGTQPAPPEFEEGGQATVDDLVQVNPGTDDDPRPTFHRDNLSENERKEYIE